MYYLPNSALHMYIGCTYKPGVLCSPPDSADSEPLNPILSMILSMWSYWLVIRVSCIQSNFLNLSLDRENSNEMP